MSTRPFSLHTLPELIAAHPEPDAPIVAGLLRRGEVVNIVAPPKVGKTLLVAGLAMSLSAGQPWLGCATTQGSVLLLDNELRPALYAQRSKALLDAYPDSDPLRIHVVLLRGSQQDLSTLREPLTAAVRACGAIVLVIDSLYRAMPLGTSENDPIAVAALYDVLLDVATETQVGIIVVHHATKGSQSRRGVSDVGSGSGAISRIVDGHLILREHAEDGHFVADAVVRSWPAFAPRVITRDQGLVWRVVAGADPGRLRTQMRRRSPPVLSLDAVCAVLDDAPTPVAAIAASLIHAGHQVTTDVLRVQLERLAKDGRVHRSVGDRGAICFGLVPVSASSKTDQVVQAVQRDPHASAATIARQVGCDPALVRRVLRATSPHPDA